MSGLIISAKESVSSVLTWNWSWMLQTSFLPSGVHASCPHISAPIKAGCRRTLSWITLDIVVEFRYMTGVLPTQALLTPSSVGGAAAAMQGHPQCTVVSVYALCGDYSLSTVWSVRLSVFGLWTIKTSDVTWCAIQSRSVITLSQMQLDDRLCLRYLGEGIPIVLYVHLAQSIIHLYMCSHQNPWGDYLRYIKMILKRQTSTYPQTAMWFLRSYKIYKCERDFSISNFLILKLRLNIDWSEWSSSGHSPHRSFIPRCSSLRCTSSCTICSCQWPCGRHSRARTVPGFTVQSPGEW